MSKTDGWGAALAGMGPWSGLDRVADAGPAVEPDDSLRERLVYVAGDSERVIHEISVARGAELDAIAERYLLKRRS